MTSVPLVAACLIVRDEADRLPSCIASLRGAVTEIVVHDTGSVDASVSIARSLGATVIEGSWSDDFARARNAALDACTATWILHVDADETLAGDVEALLDLLASGPPADAFIVDVENLLDDGTGSSYVSRACRIFRRERARWEGIVHEQVVARTPAAALRVASLPVDAHLLHTGYLTEAMRRGDKLDRNVRLAQRALDEARAGGATVDPELLLDLGRSLKGAGRLADAAERCLEAARVAGGGRVGREALTFAIGCLLGLDRTEEAAAAVSTLREWSRRPDVADFLAGQVALSGGDGREALLRFEGLGPGNLTSDDGRSWPTAIVTIHRGLAHAACGDWAAAAECFAEAVCQGAVRGNLGLFLDAARRLGREPADVLAALLVSPSAALLDELATVLRDLAPHFEIEEALEWAIALRDHDVTEPSPLVDWAVRNEAAAPGLRVYAAAAAAALGDTRGLALIDRYAPDVVDDVAQLVRDQLAGMQPALAARFDAARPPRVPANHGT